MATSGQRKIRITAEARKVLAELDAKFDRYLELSEKLGPDGHIPDSETAIGIGAEREHMKALIVGCAWRLLKATGRKDWRDAK